MGGGGGGFGGAGGFADIFEDIFGEMMGGGRQRRSGGRERGADLRYNMEITLEEAYAGKTAQIRRTCPTCHGRGQTIKDPCTKCSGQGRITEERSLSVNIPAGIEDGTRIRLTGEGEAGVRGGPSGDLYIFLSLKPHEFFQRDGSDLY
eukprot:gene29032-35436_t